jgi:hypothetical protein
MTDYNILKDATITKRINEAATNFTLNLATPLPPHKFHSGDEFEYSLYDETQDDFTVVKGILEDVNRNKETGSGIVYTTTGRDMGRLLVKQPFNLDCADATGNDYSFSDILNTILTDTGVKIGRGQKPLRTDLKITTNNTPNDNRWCGQWNTKQEALNGLLELYRELAGLNKIRWFIDFGGFLRWFEISNNNRIGKRFIFKDDENLITWNPGETCKEVINIVKGRYGDESTGELIVLKNDDSVNQFGKCISPEIISNTNLTREQIINKLQKELDQKSVPIYSGTLILSGFHHYEPGTQMEFPDDNDYGDKTFTVVDWSYNGKENTTSMNLTTDETVISLPNEIEIMRAVAVTEANMVRSDIGIVTSNDNEQGRLTCLSYTTGAKINARDLSKS